jgi:hypothetical protein
VVESMDHTLQLTPAPPAGGAAFPGESH